MISSDTRYCKVSVINVRYGFLVALGICPAVSCFILYPPEHIFINLCNCISDPCT
jgi:hypothetical protein